MKHLALILTICLLMTSTAAAQDDSAPDITFEYVSGTPIEGRITFDSLAFNRLIQRIDPPLGADRWIVELDSATGEFINVISAPVAAGNFKWHEAGYYSYGYSEPATMLEAQTRLRSGEGVLVATLNASFVVTDDDLNQLLHIGDINMPLDPHELTFLPNGNFAFFSTQVMDIPDDFHRCQEPPCVLLYQHMHEMNLDGEIVRTWDLRDYYAPEDLPPSLNSDEYQPRAAGYPDAPEVVDLTHMNTITITPDGDLLLGSRQFSDVMRLDTDTGEIIWRIGGPSDPYNEFTFVDDPFDGFASQHLPTILPNGNLLLFDNGNARNHNSTRVVEYELDVENRSATQVWAYAPPEGDYFADTRGSAQRLPDGNTLINWVDRNPNIEIVTPEGEVVLQITLPEHHSSYRALWYPPRE
jgi:hypothetical protein